jgi:hypothetical protein
MGSSQQMLFSYGGSGLGTLTLDDRDVFAQATSFANFEATTSVEIQVLASGIINFITSASGNGFTDQQGDGFYNWISGGSPSLYSVRAIPAGDTFNGSPLNTWIPATSNPTWFASVITGNVPSSALFISDLTLQLALTSQVSNILESGIISVSLFSETTGRDSPIIP